MVITIVAPNPSPMTLEGTNTYLVLGDGEALCIDPGPKHEGHISSIEEAAAARGVRIACICVTHGHPDHAPGAQLLAQRSGAPIAGHRDATFAHDIALADGEDIRVRGARLTAIDAPGHTFDSLVYYEPQERALFSGDVVLGAGTVLVAPPDGAMRPYQRTLQRLLTQYGDARRIYGGHGPVVDDPRGKLKEYIAHRALREQQLLDALREGPRTTAQLVETIYADVDRVLWPAAGHQLSAHLIALIEERSVATIPQNGDDVTFTLVDT